MLYANLEGFQSTRPLRGATLPASPRTDPGAFQSTRPLRGATRLPGRVHPAPAHFNPRAPCGARPRIMFVRLWRMIFQSTRPLRGATTFAVSEIMWSYDISIHAPLAGRDAFTRASVDAYALFQSTRPLRGATAKAHKKMRHFCAKGINTSSLCAKNAHPAT